MYREVVIVSLKWHFNVFFYIERWRSAFETKIIPADEDSLFKIKIEGNYFTVLLVPSIKI